MAKHCLEDIRSRFSGCAKIVVPLQKLSLVPAESRIVLPSRYCTRPFQRMDCPPEPPAPTATPQIQQALATLAQMCESVIGPVSAEQRQQAELSIQTLAADQTRTQSSLKSTQESLSLVQRDLVASHHANHQLQQTINGLTSRINGLEKFVVALKEDLARVMQRLAATSHGMGQFENRVAMAHNQLSERVTHQIAQQAAQIGTFQNQIVGPFFSAMQQVLLGQAVSCETASVHAPQPSETPSDLSVAAASAHQEPSRQDTPDLDTNNAPVRDAVSPSCSQSSDTPLLRASIARRNETASVSVDPQPPNDDIVVASTAAALNRDSTRSLSQTILTALEGLDSVTPPAPRRSSEALFSSASHVPQEPTIQARVQGPSRLLPLPSPSPSLSPSVGHLLPRATLETSSASLTSSADQLRSEETATASGDEVEPTNASTSSIKRKRTPSVECLRVQLAKKPHHSACRSWALSRTSAGTERTRQGHDTPAMSLHVDPSASFAPPRSVESRASESAGKTAALVRNLATFRTPTRDPRRPNGITATLQTPAASDSPRAPLIVAKQSDQQASREQLMSSSSQTSAPHRPSNDGDAPQSVVNTMTSTAVSTESLQLSQQQSGPITSPESSRDIAATCSERISELPASIVPAEPTPLRNDIAHRTQAPGQPTPLARIKIEMEDAEPVSNAEPEPPQATLTAPAASESQTQPPEAEQERLHSSDESRPEPTTTQQHVGREVIDHQMDSRSNGTPDATQPAKAKETQPPARDATIIPRVGEATNSSSTSESTQDVATPQTSGGRTRPESRTSRSEHRWCRDPDRRTSGDQLNEDRAWQKPAVRHEASKRDATREYIRQLSSFNGSRGDYYEPFFLCAWLGRAKELIGDVSATTPVVIAPDRSVTESLIAENLARDLIRRGDARIVDSRDPVQWLELDVTWLFDADGRYHTQSRTRRFEAARCPFLIVPTAYMKDGIVLGKEELQRHNLRVTRRSSSARPYLAIDGRVAAGVSLNAFLSQARKHNSLKPFERLCALAEDAMARIHDPRCFKQFGRRDRPEERRVAGPTTPSLAARLSGSIAELAASSTAPAALPAPNYPSEYRANRNEDRRSQTGRKDARTSSGAAPTRRHRANTPHPLAGSSEEEARSIRALWEQECGISTSLDTGSPLTETNSPEAAGRYDDEVDELEDD